MRNLQTTDIFELARVVKKIGIKEQLKEIAQKVNEGTDTYQLGFEIILSLIEKFSEKNSEEAFYEFLAPILEVASEEVGKMDPFELVESILKIASIEKWQSFLKLAVR